MAEHSWEMQQLANKYLLRSNIAKAVVLIEAGQLQEASKLLRETLNWHRSEDVWLAALRKMQEQPPAADGEL